MATVKLGAGAIIETVTPGELRTHLKDRDQAIFAEMARGVKPDRFYLSGTVSGGALALPAVGAQTVGPLYGMVWAIQRITVAGLSNSSDVLNVDRNTSDGTQRLGVMTAASPTVHVGSKGIILFGGETLNIYGSSLTSTGLIDINGEVIQIPQYMLWKLLT